jgi:hypothetical protein
LLSSLISGSEPAGAPYLVLGVASSEASGVDSVHSGIITLAIDEEAFHPVVVIVKRRDENMWTHSKRERKCDNYAVVIVHLTNVRAPFNLYAISEAGIT